MAGDSLIHMDTPIFILLLILLVWVGWLTFSFRRLHARYMLFTGGVSRNTLDTVLTKIIKENTKSQQAIAQLMSRCATIEKEERLHIQKIGLLRFNPFKDTGGDHSFILTLADSYDTGVVITALYARTGMRWYAKRVVKGKGIEHELSDEEKKALSLAEHTK